MVTVLVVAAALLYTVGGYCMKLSKGFAVAGPSVGVFACFCAGAALQTLAMRRESMTVTYVVVLGLEAVIAYLLGTFWLQEPTSAAKIAGVVLVVAGIALLRAS